MPLCDYEIDYHEILRGTQKAGIIIVDENGMHERNTDTYNIALNEKKIFDDEDLNDLYDYIDERIYQDKSSTNNVMYSFTMNIVTSENMLKFNVDVCMVEEGYGTEFYPKLVHIDDVNHIYGKNKIIYHKKDYSDLITCKKIGNGYKYTRKLTDIQLDEQYGKCLDEKSFETDVTIEIYTKNKAIRDLILKRFKHYVAFV